MNTTAIAVLAAFSAATLYLVKVFVEEIVRREYDSWAPALARAMVKLASMLCSHAAKEFRWSADLQAEQASPGNASGLFFAFGCLAGVPLLGLRTLRARVDVVYRLATQRGIALTNTFWLHRIAKIRVKTGTEIQAMVHAEQAWRIAEQEWLYVKPPHPAIGTTDLARFPEVQLRLARMYQTLFQEVESGHSSE